MVGPFSHHNPKPKSSGRKHTEPEREEEEMEEVEAQRPEILSPCSSGRRSGDSTSPEFEFWMVRNPSFPQPNLLSADELFSDGVLLPLDLLPQEGNACSDESPGENLGLGGEEPPETSGSTRPGIEVSAAAVGGAAAVSGSKRWKDIFKKGEKKEKKGGSDENVKEKEKKEKKGGVMGPSAAELNINIWPFSRSRSAGNGGARPRLGAAGSGLTHRKVSSAPCSRSNSAGESKSRKWPTSPTRAGVHLGRSSPVWQVRRTSAAAATRTTENLSKAAEKALKKETNADKPAKKDGNFSKSLKKEGNDTRRKNSSAAVHGAAAPKARVLNLNVPMCIGYRHHLSCRSDENSTIAVAAAAAAAAASDGGQNGGGVPGEAVRGSNLFNLRNLFTKKVY
nr:uncharacterized protein LOC109164828 [Ipomoea trifida]